MAAANDPELIDWLLSPENAVVRYLTARDLTTDPSSPTDLARLRQAAIEWGPLQQVFDLQLDDGSFPSNQKTMTLQPSIAAVQVFHLCGLTVDDEPVRKLLRYLSKNSFESALTYTGGASGVLPCYVGVTAAALIKMGAANNDLVQSSIRWLLDFQRFDRKGVSVSNGRNTTISHPSRATVAGDDLTSLARSLRDGPKPTPPISLRPPRLQQGVAPLRVRRKASLALLGGRCIRWTKSGGLDGTARRSHA